MKYFILFTCLFSVLKIQAQEIEITASQLEENIRAGVTKPVVLHSSCKSISAIDSSKPLGQLPAGFAIDLILISKKTRMTYLFSQNNLIYKFKSTFGKAWNEGAKIKEGDKRTPEGIYTIDSKNYDSKFHNALHISYPNAYDKKFAEQNGYASAGSDIMMHGLPNFFGNMTDAEADNFNKKNWTAGCVAFKNSDIDKIMSLIKVPTTVAICPL